MKPYPIVLLALLVHAPVHARGVSPYLPLHLDPEAELQIERVLILADKPIMKRPIAAAAVLDALPKACTKDQTLCEEVRRYLHRYMSDSGVTSLAITGLVTSGGDQPVPNNRGLIYGSVWSAHASAYWQPTDYLLINLGGLAHEGDTQPTGSVISAGFSYAQLDIGYRDHWLSPLADSAMLISTEAPTMASVTLSNYTPITRLGLRYELFTARMSKSDNIAFQDRTTSGRPRLAGLHLSTEPAVGWSLALNRVMQYGGGLRGGGSLSDLFRALSRPTRFDNASEELSSGEFGNQAASITSRFLFPGKPPFAVYFEYAGEDTSSNRDYLLGNAALSAGIHFPRLGRRFDAAYEVSEWQNGWYVHHIYRDGLTNEGAAIGHWGADQSRPPDGVGAQSHMARLGWSMRSGAMLNFHLRTLAKETYGPVPYTRASEISLRYGHPWRQFMLGGEALAGQDIFGEDYSRFGVFVRFTGERREAFDSMDQDPLVSSTTDAEIFVDVGMNANQVKINLDDKLPGYAVTKTDLQTAPHFAVGARRAISERGDLGARLELDDIDGHLLLGVRALDYRHRFNNPLALGVFVGAARYDIATPAFGLYFGIGAEWRNIWPMWNLGLDLRYASRVARDDLLTTDPLGGRPDSFYDISSATLSVRRSF